MTYTKLFNKIRNRDIIIGVIGLGYVGLPLCISLTRKNLKTIGFDIDLSKCISLAKGQSYLEHIDHNVIGEMNAGGQFVATSDFNRLAEVDGIIICVPTPLTRHREPDLSYLKKTAEVIASHLRRDQIVLLKSTTYPGTTDEILRPILEKSGLAAHIDFFIAYSPEREDPGNVQFTTSKIPKVVGADTDAEKLLAESFYKLFIDEVIPVQSTRTAEMVKLNENIFRCVNIALINEMKIVCEAMGIDIWDVVNASSTKPFGYMPFYPGPGLGGHCIPVDPFYLTWKAKEFDISTRFIELAGEINTNMPLRIVDRLSEALNSTLGKCLRNAKILVVGIAYKKNVCDLRESPALKIIELLENKGAHVAYYDPYVPTIPEIREYAMLHGRRSEVWHTDLAAGFDASLVITDHDEVDYASLAAQDRLVVDTRNACRRAGINSSLVIQA